MKTQRKYLLVSYGGGHVQTLLPIYKKLLEDKADVHFLACTTAQLKMKEAGLPFIDYTTLLKRHPQADHIKNIGRSLISDELNPHIPLDESLAYHGLCFWELIQEYGEKKASDLFNEKGRSCFFPLLTLKKFIQDENINFIITTNSPRSEKAALKAAYDLNLKSVCILDCLDIEANHLYVKDSQYGSKLCVPDKKTKNFIESKGRSAEEIIITGNPAFTHLKKLSSDEIIQLKKEYQIGKRKVITWIKSYSPLSQSFELKVEKFLNDKFGHEYLVFRPHPNDPIFYDSVTLNKEPYRLNLAGLNNILNLSDVILTLVSTVGLEANILSKPVIQITIEKPFPCFSFESFEIGREAKDWESIEKNINQALNYEWQTQSPFTGDSISNVLAVIDSV